LATIAAAIAAFAVTPGAFAATPKDICDDLADGTLNGTYSSGDIAAYVAALGSDPTIQGYCTPLMPAAPEQPVTPQQSGPESGVLGETKAAGTLPFTGTELTIFAVVGLALVAAGLMLRSTGKQRT
jgi:hypothetical protein